MPLLKQISDVTRLSHCNLVTEGTVVEWLKFFQLNNSRVKYYKYHNPLVPGTFFPSNFRI